MFTQTIDQNPNINILSFPCSVSPLNKEISLDNLAKYKLKRDFRGYPETYC